jgi:hypothetical protein
MAFLAIDNCLRLERNCKFVANSADYILMLSNDLFVYLIKLENIEKQSLSVNNRMKALKITNMQFINNTLAMLRCLI